MATTKLNSLIVEAARRLKDQRSTAASSDDTGKVYNSAVLTGYANRAVRELLRELFEQYGEKFGDLVPEYMRTSSALTLAAGVTAQPADAWFVLNLVKSDRTVKFHKVPSNIVEDVRSGEHGTIVPSLTRPVFWQEGGSIYTLGVTTGDVIGRYVRVHPDLSVITTAVGNGVIYATAGNLTWTAATKTLTVSGGAGTLTSADVNKVLMFRTATVVYLGRIQGVSGDMDVVLYGDALPTGNILPSNIIEFVVSDRDPDSNDLALGNIWFPIVLDKMVRMGREDALSGVV